MTNRSLRLACIMAAWFHLAASAAAASNAECHPGASKSSEPTEIQAFVREKGKKVVTLVGYSAAEYEDPAAMRERVESVLKRFDPARTVINSGATAPGIGAAYELAKQLGFETMGIVSELARREHVELSPCVDFVFYGPDETWGGIVAGTQSLSPTSTAMVRSSDVVVAIGGGEVARDELLAARAAGKETEVFPADMNHRLAIEKAKKKGAPAPTDFSGAVGAALKD